ncbi:hypothetical protein TIFTF001_028506 [Ficus carica]|uniref:Uncharacterized protein n=1 Tax=Ficus carica TaxID=3494 RepID=A0AA88DQ11_FICCA|nr:hypothetical protein TIFTF001_028506 [Ficus carica]
MANGKPRGRFGAPGGLRQGDPPIFFSNGKDSMEMEVCGGLITWDVLEGSARSFEEKEMEPMANGYLRERKVHSIVLDTLSSLESVPSN